MEFRYTFPLIREIYTRRRSRIPFNAQSFYKGINFSERKIMMDEAKKIIGFEIDRQNKERNMFPDVIDFPIEIKLLISPSLSKTNFDIDNYGYVFSKAFLDVIKEPLSMYRKDGALKRNPPKHYTKNPLIKEDGFNEVKKVSFEFCDENNETVTVIVKPYAKSI